MRELWILGKPLLNPPTLSSVKHPGINRTSHVADPWCYVIDILPDILFLNSFWGKRDRLLYGSMLDSKITHYQNQPLPLGTWSSPRCWVWKNQRLNKWWHNTCSLITYQESVGFSGATHLWWGFLWIDLSFWSSLSSQFCEQNWAWVKEACGLDEKGVLRMKLRAW